MGLLKNVAVSGPDRGGFPTMYSYVFGVSVTDLGELVITTTERPKVRHRSDDQRPDSELGTVPPQIHVIARDRWHKFTVTEMSEPTAS